MITGREVFRRGKLIARPAKKTYANDEPPGLQLLRLDEKRDGFLYVPKNYQSSTPTPLAVMLHGAGGIAEHGLSLLRELADEANIILLAPASRKSTWDIISGNNFGPDVIFIDQALSQTFRSYNIDTGRLAIGGFSDGASYAFSLGITNGDLFTHIIAFSPGFAYAEELEGKPKIFVSHGVHDHILPIEPCSRRLVPRFKKNGYDVQYIEFDGEHLIPGEVRKDAVDWFLK